MDSLRAHFLIASPHLPDPNFFRSVVLMIQHDGDGAMGVILNRPSDLTIGQLWEKVAEEPLDCDRPVHIGGPVPGPLMVVHALEGFSENEILPGVHFATRRELVVRILKQKRAPFLVFTGYAGWGAGQLEGELKAGGWLTLAAEKELVFGSTESLWDSVVRLVGRQILSPLFPDGEIPVDPGMN